MHQVDPKDGYSVGDCWNSMQRRLLEFLVSIVHPDKPIWVTITIGNTIFGALDGGREVDWGVVFRDLAQRLAKEVGKSKPTPICPFLFHLYEGQGLLTEDEELNYRTAKGIGRIPDHTGSGFKAWKRQQRSSAHSSTFTYLGDARAYTKPEEEEHLSGTSGVTTGREGLRAWFYQSHNRRLNRNSNPHRDRELNRKQRNWKKTRNGWRGPLPR